MAVVAVLTPIALLLSYKTVPQVKSEVDDILYYGNQYVENADHYYESLYYPYSGTQTRLIMWRLSAEQISEKPLGVGTGDVDDALEVKMSEKGLHQEFIDQHFNPHNQYLQILIEVGIVGFLLIMIFFTKVLIKSWKEKDYLLLILLANCVMNCLFESMFQRQSGMMFYTILFCYLLIPKAEKLIDEH